MKLIASLDCKFVDVLKFDVVQKYNHYHDRRGRFSTSDVGALSVAALLKHHLFQHVINAQEFTDKTLGSRSNPIQVGANIEKAAKLISEGKHVILNQPDQVSTLVHKIKTEYDDYVEHGKEPPVWNLANISVKGTNLFAHDNLGIPRVYMPQFKSTVAAGSRAAKELGVKPGEKVDLKDKFLDYMKEKGISSTETEVDASHLRSTQNELDAIKVEKYAEKLKLEGRGRGGVIVTKDNYVLDGHHRWAAAIVDELKQGQPLKIPVTKLNVDIGKAFTLATDFTKEWGLQSKSIAKSDLQSIAIRVLKFNPNHDKLGLFSSGSGGGGAEVEGDKKKFEGLKSEWATVNNDLLSSLDKPPDSPEVKAGMSKLQDISKQIHGLHVDKGGMEGIGFPGGPRDMVMVGAGPGGLAASVMGAADGLDTLFIDAQEKVGGQAKYSSRIENYPGFPIGTSGAKLAGNLYEQALRLGAEGKQGVRVTGLAYDPDTQLKTLTLSNGEKIESRAVVIAGGLEFRKMNFPGSDSKSIVYADGETLAKIGKDKPVVVVGGSNGAAQAALGVAQTASHVYLLSRSNLEKSMSDYQVQAVRNNKKIEVIENDEIAKLFNDDHNEATKLVTKGGKELPANAVGMFLGSAPDTKWMPPEIQRNNGKVVVDRNYETGIPGVFAVGDIRDGGIGRIGAAVGEGQIAERNVFGYFDRLKEQQASKEKAVKYSPDQPRDKAGKFALQKALEDAGWFQQGSDDEYRHSSGLGRMLTDGGSGRWEHHEMVPGGYGAILREGHGADSLDQYVSNMTPESYVKDANKKLKQHGVKVPEMAAKADKLTQEQWGKLVDEVFRVDAENPYLSTMAEPPTKTDLQSIAVRVLKFNGNHDSKTGEFTSGPAGPASKLAEAHPSKMDVSQIMQAAFAGNQREQQSYGLKLSALDQKVKNHQTTADLNKIPGTNRYTPGRLAVQRQVIAELFKHADDARPAEGHPPTAIFLGGRGASGKSNFDVGKNPDGVYDPKRVLVMDSDRIKELLPGYTPETAALYHEESTKVLARALTEAKKQGLNVVMDATMKSYGKVHAWVNSFKKAGHRIEGYYVHRPADLAAKSAVERYLQPTKVHRLGGKVESFSNGRLVPVGVVLKNKSNEKNFDSIIPKLDHWAVYDNSDPHQFRFDKVAEGDRVKKQELVLVLHA